jgi:hypothetical protein
VRTQWHTFAYEEPRTIGGVPFFNADMLTSTRSFDATGEWASTTHDYDANGKKYRDQWTIAGQTHAVITAHDAGEYLVAKSWSSFPARLRQDRRHRPQHREPVAL